MKKLLFAVLFYHPHRYLLKKKRMTLQRLMLRLMTLAK